MQNQKSNSRTAVKNLQRQRSQYQGLMQQKHNKLLEYVTRIYPAQLNILNRAMKSTELHHPLLLSKSEIRFY